MSDIAIELVHNLPNERWIPLKEKDGKPIVTQKKIYYISNCGRVKTIHKKNKDERLRTPYELPTGQLIVPVVVEDGRSLKIIIATRVAKRWVKAKSDTHKHIIHKDGDLHNNHYKNLKWANWKDFKLHRKNNPPLKKGERPPSKMVLRVRSHWNERWKKVETRLPTKTNEYYISDHGRAKRIHKVTGDETLVKLTIVRSDYRIFKIRLEDHSSVTIFMSKRIARNWVEGETEERKFVIQLDGDKANNHYKNLKWVSRKELTQHQYDIGMYDNNYSKHQKLTYSQVVLLKRKLKEGKIKPKILARNFNITLTQVKRIARGENWKHVNV